MRGSGIPPEMRVPTASLTADSRTPPTAADILAQIPAPVQAMHKGPDGCRHENRVFRPASCVPIGCARTRGSPPGGGGRNRTGSRTLVRRTGPAPAPNPEIAGPAAARETSGRASRRPCLSSIPTRTPTPKRPVHGSASLEGYFVHGGQSRSVTLPNRVWVLSTESRSCCTIENPGRNIGSGNETSREPGPAAEWRRSTPERCTAGPKSEGAECRIRPYV